MRKFILVMVLLSVLSVVWGSAIVVDENTLTIGDMKSENSTPEFLKLTNVSSGLANHSNEQYSRIIRESFDLESDNLFSSQHNLDSKIRYILSNASDNNIDPDHLVLSSSYLTDKSDNLSIMKYVQKFKGLNIHSSRIIVGIKDGKVVTLKSNYYPEIDIDTEPTLSEEDIIEIIEMDIGFQLIRGGLKPRETFSFEKLQANKSTFVRKIYTSENRTTVENILLVIYPESKSTEIKYHLAYKVELGLNLSPPSKWVYIIDANNGEILEKYNKVVFTTLNGHVAGRIYQEHPAQSPVERNFWNETVYDFTDHLSNIFWSGRNDSLDNYIFTKNPISITNVSSATLEFKTKFFMENEHDFGYVVLSTDGKNYSNLEEYTGIKGNWSTIKINLSSFIGQQIWIGFRYITDNINSDNGWYIDDISVLTNNGSIFKDFADNFTNWNEKGFSVIQQEVTSNQELGKTGADGFYNLSGLHDSFTLSTGLAGEFVNVLNETGVEANHYAIITTPSTHDIDWGNDDTSYRKEQSNVFFHINLVHDFFTKGNPFNIYAMNYQTQAHVQYPGTCNAFSDGTNIYFSGAGGSCEPASLFSDIIYHEYTHNVIDHMYTTHAPLLPYRVESGALNEGLADYFASSINGNPCIAEGLDGDCVRYLNNTYRFPEDVVGETHKDSRIVSGSSWDLREMLGSDISDSLVINSMKLEPFNFSEYLDDIIVADDDNANLEDGTPHLFEICTAFFKNHGIFSPYCSIYYRIPTTVNLLINPGFESESANWTEYSNGGYPIIKKNSMGTYSGNWLAYMGDYNNVSQYIFQDMIIPSGIEKVYVQFWYWITSKETTERFANDTMRIEIRRHDDMLLKSLGTLSNLNKSHGYSISEQYDLSEFKNQTIRLKLTTTTDLFAPTAFLVDDIALMAVYGTIPPPVFIANLSGSEQVPQLNTSATGQAIFILGSLHYKLTVSNITNVTVAHIHLAPAGENGPIVVTLYSGPTISGRFDGVLAEGNITTTNLTGPLAGMPLSTLIDNMTAGNTYVNVHTIQNPAGEIRGQIKPAQIPLPPLFNVSGFKINNVTGGGIPGWNITLTMPDGTKTGTLTDMNGMYQFMNLPNGTYRVAEVLQTGWTNVSSMSQIVTINGVDKSNVNFTNALIPPTGGSISGMKFNDLNNNSVKDANESGLANWTINLTDQDGSSVTATTDNNGSYTFINLTPGNYTVAGVLKTGWIQTFPANGTYNVTITGNENITGIDFGNNLSVPQPPTNATVAVRTIEKESLRSGESTDVTVNISSTTSQALSLKEIIQAGWNLTRISDDVDAFKNSTNEWIWFNVTQGINKTVVYRLTAPDNASIGTYHINGTVSNSSGVIAVVQGDNTITLDLLAYYRRLGRDHDRVETTDVLTAIDDWKNSKVPAGFEQPISTQELLALIDEWLMS